MAAPRFAEDDPRFDRAGRDDPPRPAGLDPIAGVAHFAGDLEQRRSAVRRLAIWAMRCHDREVRAAAELMLDATAAGRWDELADDLGVVRKRGGVPEAVADAIVERDRLIRQLRRTLPKAAATPSSAAAARAIHDELNRYGTTAWPRHRSRSTAPADPVAAACWRCFRLPLPLPVPSVRTIRRALAAQPSI